MTTVAGPQAVTAGWKCWWLAARPRTLTASIVPIVVGLALAPPRSSADLAIAVCTLLSALSIQVAVNFANDCYDAEAGIDTAERLGPQRAVQSGLVTADTMRRAFFFMAFAATVFGVPLIVRGGGPILIVGVISLVCAWAYAGGSRPLASLGLGDVFVFVFFGVVPVAGTVWLQRLSLDSGVLSASIPTALLAVAILVVNNLRDIPTDRAAGKRTLAVRIGERATRNEYALCVVVAMLWTLLLAFRFGPGVFATLLAVPTAWRAISGVRNRSGAELNASLAATARLQLFHGLLLAAGLAVASS